MDSLKASTRMRQSILCSLLTHLLVHTARVHRQTIAIIQPDNHGHFHEKGEFEESEHGGPSICCAMWPPHREGEIMSAIRGKSSEILIEVNCFVIFVYSAEGILPSSPLLSLQ